MHRCIAVFITTLFFHGAAHTETDLKTEVQSTGSLTPGGAPVVLVNRRITFQVFVDSAGELTASLWPGDDSGFAALTLPIVTRSSLFKAWLRCLPTAQHPQSHLAPITDDDCPSDPSWTKSVSAEQTSLELHWSGCLVGDPCEFGSPQEAVDVTLTVTLETDADHVLMDLAVSPSPAAPLLGYSLESATIRLAIESRHGFAGVEESLLLPLGYLVENPAVEMDEEEFFDCQLRSTTQVSALCRTAGVGLYIATRDGTGLRTRNFRYGSIDVAGSPHTVVQAESFADLVGDPGESIEGIPLEVALVEGDWFDAALRYRPFVEEHFGWMGPLVARTDIPKSEKNVQMVFVIPVGVQSYKGVNASGPVTLPEQLERYMAHYGLEFVTSLQFGTDWVAGGQDGLGVYDVDVGPGSLWAQNFAIMESAGFVFGLYLSDNEYSLAHASYWSEGWFDRTITNFELWNIAVWTYPWAYIFVDANGVSKARIDPSHPEWQSRVTRFVDELASRHGIDMFFWDNFFPTRTEVNLFIAAGNLVSTGGFGPSFTRGFNDSILLAALAGRAANPMFHSPYNEVNPEERIPYAPVYGAVQPHADFVTGSSATTVVPLHAVLFHHFAGAGPSAYNDLLDATTYASCGPEGPITKTNSFWSQNVEDRERALQAAAYVTAHAFVNGSPLWNPELGLTTQPVEGDWEFEVGNIPAGAYFEPMALAARFAGECAAYRGESAAGRFLNTGRYERPVEITSPVPEVQVWVGTGTPVLESAPGEPPCYSPVEPEEVDYEVVPAILVSTLVDPLNGQLGLALANHSSQPVPEIRLEFSLSDYGLSPGAPYLVESIGPKGLKGLVTVFDGSY